MSLETGNGFGLGGAVAIVTGGGSQERGIGNGAAAAIMLARAGARVALLDRERENAEATAARIEDEGGEARVYECDVSRDEDCAATVAAVEADLGPAGVLVNNVGVAGPPGNAVEVDLERWDEDTRVNVKSMVQMSRHTLPAMLASGRGAIVNVSSAAGMLGGHPALLYATTKGAIIQMTRTMAAQHGEAGVRVNCVAPGMIYSPMVVVRGMTEEMREQRRQRSILKTEGTPWDVGAAVLFLASELGRWITGVTLPVDAGYSAGMTLPSPPRK
jgi:NAD(P)-dependent dehydrogenase (short-subunit alcohol dehydrogenase family)